MAFYAPAAAIVFKNEGGYQDNPSDKGNYNAYGFLVGTNYGISAPFYAEYFGYQPTVSDMINLTQDKARLIFKSLRWDKYGIGEIQDQDTANHIFDLFVNHSPKGASQIVQDTLTAVGYTDFGGAGFGPMTRGQINLAVNQDQNKFNTVLVDQRKAYYNYLVSKDPSQLTFLAGWLARAEQFTPGQIVAAGIGGLAFLAAIGYISYKISE